MNSRGSRFANLFAYISCNTIDPDHTSLSVEAIGTADVAIPSRLYDDLVAFRHLTQAARASAWRTWLRYR